MFPDKVTQVNPLAVDEPIAPSGHTLTGTGDNSIGEVRAYIHGDPGEETQAVFAGSDWSATFVQVLSAGMTGAVVQNEQGTDDGDQTHIWWNTANPPHFSAEAQNDSIWGHGWSAGTVEVSITGGSSWTVPVSDGSDGRTPGDVNLELNSSDPTWDVVPGNKIVLTHTTEPGESKAHVVTGLTASHDSGSVVTGGAAIDSFFDVWVEDTDVHRSDQADGSGDWSVDFSVPGDDPGETNTVTLGPGDHGSAEQCDGEGDCTRAFWSVPNPAFSIETPFSVWSTGDGWIEGATASLSIDDGGGGGAEYTDTVVINRWGPEAWEVGFNFDTQPVQRSSPGTPWRLMMG